MQTDPALGENPEVWRSGSKEVQATWKHRPDDQPTFAQLCGMLEEARPEQVLGAIPHSLVRYWILGRKFRKLALKSSGSTPFFLSGQVFLGLTMPE